MQSTFSNETNGDKPLSVQNRIFGKMGLTSAHFANSFSQPKTLFPCQGLMNPLMILVKIIKLRWIHILSYDQMVSRKINN
ncbi:hypothetical protein, partial [Klebsiella pneumoniae]|uniref:hypothetical protein n=1 Tax=Klebsiella pneumoniae TaxID=573 RepID=UPI001CA47140